MCKRVLFLAWFVSSSAFCQQAQLTHVWELADALMTPESVVFDSKTNLLYASSVNGGVTDKDGNGFISTITPDGTLVSQHWLDGLNAPKGIAVHDGKLYVADIDELVEIDIATASVLKSYPAAGAKFLNDVAIDSQGIVYVSGSVTSIIYRLIEGKLAVWISDDNLLNPNGIYAGPASLVVAAGDNSTTDPWNKRYLMAIEYQSETIKPVMDTTPLGGIDAVEPDHQSGYLLTDWSDGTIMHYSSDGNVKVLIKRERGTADLTYIHGTQMLYLPLMMENRLVAYKLEWVKDQ
jgi:hypothetical protein